jgi:hypothetical protein
MTQCEAEMRAGSSGKTRTGTSGAARRKRQEEVWKKRTELVPSGKHKDGIASVYLKRKWERWLCKLEREKKAVTRGMSGAKAASTASSQQHEVEEQHRSWKSVRLEKV